PTIWSISNVAITGFCPTDPKVKILCCDIAQGEVGSWWGGLEAIVPFVKKSPDGSYNTYLKFISRYSNPVKVYAKPFKDATEPMIIATQYVGEIPPNGGVLELNADTLGSTFGLTSTELDKGMAFKFLLRVPSQVGCISGSGTISFEVSEYYEGIGDYRGSYCFHNPNDPYVEGIVVSASPAGQRTVPLKFKFWKSGAYNH
ncbi:MAG: hypothetical protein N3A56_07945, partial [Thermodesulfobacteriaceae bacterium]|nr:hypothetical protein [Thermodesulfobacteriaceae bacterium]